MLSRPSSISFTILKPCANKKDIETEILEEFKQVLASRCEAEAKQKMFCFMRNHEVHADLVAYVDKQWFSKKDFIIMGLNARYVQGQNTNNYIESFHAFLKSDSLVGKRCDKRPDVLAHELYTFVAPTFKGKEKKVQLGIDDRRYDKAEVSAESKASGLTIEEVQTMAFLSGEGQVLINSFTDIGTQYLVHLELAGSENDTCTCLVHQNSGSLCKHIFLAKRFWKARSSTSDTSSETSDSGNSSLSASNSLKIIRMTARANDSRFSSLLDLTRLEEDPESPPDSASLDAECENDISFDYVAAQSTMADAMALDESYSIEANELSTSLLEEVNSQRQNEENGQGREEHTNWDRCILSQGPGTQCQQIASNIVDSQTVTRTREADKQHSIRLDDEKLIKDVQRIFRRRLELNSAEQIHNYVRSISDHVKEVIRDSKNPLAKQGY